MNNIENYPVLSIVIPVFNNDRFISFCLDSLLVYQTVKKDLYEIIVVNDGSSDNSLSIIQSYANEYSNVSIINQENFGVSVARNKGMELATGKFVWFVDGDDFVKANCIEFILNNLNSDIDVYHFNGYSFKQKNFYEKMILEDIQGSAQPDIWTYIFSLEFLRKNSIKFEKGIHYCESMLFVNDIILKHPYIISDSNTLYFYRINPYSATATNRQRKISCYFDILELLEKRLEKDIYPVDNTLHLIESILRMRFLNAMDDNSIISHSLIERGKMLSNYLANYLSNHRVSKNFIFAFSDFKKLCKHIQTKNWKKYLYRWRKRYKRRKNIVLAVKHPKRTIKKILKK